MKTPEDQELIDLRHRGATWASCAAQLGSTSSSLRGRACRLRDAKQWTLADGSAADGGPVVGRLGRPRNKIPTVQISPRFAPEVAEALHAVADSAGVRLGKVFAAAMDRAVARADGRELDPAPLGLDPGRPVRLTGNELRHVTITVNVPEPIYDAFLAHAKRLWVGARVNTRITHAVHALLHDLNYRF